MLRIACPNCQSKLNAKEKLLGQTRNCPKCGTPVLIQPPDDATTAPQTEDETPTIHVEPDQAEPLAKVVAVADPVSKFTSPNRYLILDRQRLVAVWEGDGWQLKTFAGLIPAKRNTEEIPGQGIFRLVELRVTRTEDAMHLTGIVCHELVPRWALPAIGRGDNQILEKIIAPAGFTRDHKQLVRNYLKDNFMPEVWRDSHPITDFLANDDHHTQGVV